MNRFRGFVRKEFYHIIRDKRSLFILFGMPIVQILLFGFAITNEINNVDVAVLNKSNDVATRQILNRIEASPYFTIKSYLDRDKDIQEAFQKGSIRAVLIFEENFSQNLQNQKAAKVQVITDATEPNTARSISSYIQAILQTHQKEIQISAGTTAGIIPKTRMLFNPELKSVFMFVPGVMTVILMLVSAMMTSISITREKELGTMEILLVSPLNPLQVILGKVFPYIFLSIINAGVIIALGFWVFDMPLKGNFIFLAFETVLFIICALSLGILISTISETQQTAMMISLAGLMLPVILLSGFIFPISSMPYPLQLISNMIPAKWFIIILKGIMIKGTSLAFLWKPTFILLLMTTFFVGLSVRKYKIRLE